jgi:zona occludens toxin (predicted ATPase)
MHLYIIFKIIYYESRKSRYNKTRKPTRKSFKKGYTKNVNKYQTLFNNVRTRVLYSLLIQQLLYVCYAYLLITKLLKILIFTHGEHKKKLIRMYSILFYIHIDIHS